MQMGGDAGACGWACLQETSLEVSSWILAAWLVWVVLAQEREAEDACPGDGEPRYALVGAGPRPWGPRHFWEQGVAQREPDVSGSQCPFVVFLPYSSALSVTRLPRKAAGGPGAAEGLGGQGCRAELRGGRHSPPCSASPAAGGRRAAGGAWRGWRRRLAAEHFPAHGSCCDQEEEDVAGAQCFLPDKPAPPWEPWPGYLRAQSPAREGPAEEENHFSRLARPGRAFLPRPVLQPQETGPGPSTPRGPHLQSTQAPGPGTPACLGASAAKSPESGSLPAPKSTTSKEGSDCKPFYVFVRSHAWSSGLKAGRFLRGQSTHQPPPSHLATVRGQGAENGGLGK